MSIPCVFNSLALAAMAKVADIGKLLIRLDNASIG
jgi:hypothetical protein